MITTAGAPELVPESVFDVLDFVASKIIARSMPITIEAKPMTIPEIAIPRPP